MQIDILTDDICRPARGTDVPGSQSRCRYCSAPIVWAVTVNGKRIPVDPDPNPRGNLMLGTGPDGVTTAQVIALGSPQGRQSHFATCPQAGTPRPPWSPVPAELEP